MVISGLAAADRTVSVSGSSAKPWPEGWKTISTEEIDLSLWSIRRTVTSAAAPPLWRTSGGKH